ncbi:MAG TPA: hypothetical protein VKE51_30015 [Vicinamibacterales bacterium]|nr:hypothetical protein [Vicinamibacterales bacterium]
MLDAIYHPSATIATRGLVISGATAIVSNNVTVMFDLGCLSELRALSGSVSQRSARSCRTSPGQTAPPCPNCTISENWCPSPASA